MDVTICEPTNKPNSPEKPPEPQLEYPQEEIELKSTDETNTKIENEPPPSIYHDLNNIDLGEKVIKLQQQNSELLNHINKLEGDIGKLCKELTNMKSNEDKLKRNISELFNTAKLEVGRKDRMIADLRRDLDDLLFKRRNVPHNNFGVKRSRDEIPEPVKRQKFESMECKKYNRSDYSHRSSHKTRSRSRSYETDNSRHRSQSNYRKYDRSEGRDAGNKRLEKESSPYGRDNRSGSKEKTASRNSTSNKNSNSVINEVFYRDLSRRYQNSVNKDRSRSREHFSENKSQAVKPEIYTKSDRIKLTEESFLANKLKSIKREKMNDSYIKLENGSSEVSKFKNVAIKKEIKLENTFEECNNLNISQHNGCKLTNYGESKMNHKSNTIKSEIDMNADNVEISTANNNVMANTEEEVTSGDDSQIITNGSSKTDGNGEEPINIAVYSSTNRGHSNSRKRRRCVIKIVN